MKGRLNAFQTAMLRWRELHPYSAVHIVRVDGPLDPARLAARIGAELEALGLTGLTLDAKRARYEYGGGPAAPAIRVCGGAADPMPVLRGEIERELNAPFPRDGAYDPFRFFAVDAGTAFYLGLTYDHLLAAGDSIVVLMQRLHAACSGIAPRASASPWSRYPPTYRRLMLQHPGRWLRGLGQLRQMAASCRRSVRPRYPRAPDPYNAFTHFSLDPTTFAAVMSAAKSWRVTLNDLLLALLMQALDPVVGPRPASERRNELAVASVINLRGEFGLDANATFGQFLSSFRVSHPLPPGTPLATLAQDIHRETAQVKNAKLYRPSLMAVGVSGLLWRLLSVERRHKFHTKNYPTWGAITTVNVDALWAHAGGAMPPPEYLRAVSTGPSTPLVLAVSTAGGTLDAGISYRTAAFTTDEVDRIVNAVVAGAQQLVRS